eukprot:CAMPEP_0118974156 /NCGR_PEP_ID=MMETSP1173-20130426/11100_1 /TAXON_ID=1034831 /ORGANISM="Rhizochromulina marina cf, Strain CCMP1243" /LENGTH=171 /DNA_ID=CAMNT_0006923865 /DNA_START=15 /DNA_END=530 /DNA_ORIENTATION=+
MKLAVVVLSLAAAVLALGSPAAAKAAKEDPKECEVCVKVLEDVEALLDSDEKSSKVSIEEALGTHCARKDLSAKEKKMCYNMEPIKKSVSHPFSLRMPKKKVCQRLKKDNPDICEIKFPVKVAKEAKPEDVSKLRVKQLKQILNDRGVECKGCVEKADFVKKVLDTQHLEF